MYPNQQPQQYGMGGTYNQPANYGFQYPQQKPMRSSNFLSKEEMESLKKVSGFNLNVTQEDINKGRCNHKNEHGDSAVYYDPADPLRNTLCCPICSEKFHVVSGTTEQVQDACSLINDILQNIKLTYFDMSTNAGREFFSIIPLINKVPGLYEQSIRNFNAYESANQLTNANQPYGYSLLNSIMNPMAYGNQQMPGMPQQMPSMQQQPYYGNQQMPGMPQQPYYDNTQGGMPQQQYAPPVVVNQPYVGNAFGGYYPPNQQPMGNVMPQAQQTFIPQQNQAAPAQPNYQNNPQPAQAQQKPQQAQNNNQQPQNGTPIVNTKIFTE